MGLSKHVFLFVCISFLSFLSTIRGEDLATLIQTLGDGKTYMERERATEALVRIGVQALPQLAKAKIDNNLERRYRARRVEKEILDILAWNGKPFELEKKQCKLSDMFLAIGENERLSFVFGDPYASVPAPPDPIGDWKVSGYLWEGLEKLCARNNLEICPVGIAGRSCFRVSEKGKDCVGSVWMEQGIRFVLDGTPERGLESPHLVLRFYALGDMNRMLCAGSREAYVLQAETDTGEKLTSLRDVEIGCEVSRNSYLSLNSFYTRFSLPSKPCREIKEIKLDVMLYSYALPEQAKLDKIVRGSVLKFGDGSEWIYRGYGISNVQSAELKFAISSHSPRPHPIGSPKIFVSDDYRWTESLSPANIERDSNGDILLTATFSAPGIRWPQQIELRYYTRLVKKRFQVTFAHIPLALKE